MASTIKVDNVQNQPGTNIINKCSVTTTVGAGAGETVNVCAATVNLGRSGGTVNLTCGATQSGFGRTGTVDWQTTVKTGDFTAANGEGYFVNTTSGAVVVTLPTGSAGSIIAIKDYAGTFDTTNCSLSPAGVDKINGVADDATLNTQGVSVTLVFIDSTKGWLAINDSTQDTTGVVPAYVAATGGTITTAGDYKIHIFTGPGTFCVSCAGNPAGSGTVDYIVTAAGGGGGRTGAGGAGGLRFASSTYCAPVCTSPRAGSAIPVPASGIPITIGGGGTGLVANPVVPVPAGNAPTKGNNSVFSTITSTGGGSAFNSQSGATTSSNGGSGGGGVPYACRASFGQGNSPPVSPPQGFSTTCNPSLPACNTGVDGGGAGGNTANISPDSTPRTGAVGLGFPTDIMKSCAGVASPSPTVRFLAGGGGGGSHVNPSTFTTAQHGGGNGGGATPGSPGAATNGSNGTTNTGGGGGGGGAGTGRSTCPPQGGGGDGGSGIVIIRYKYQN